MTDPTQRITPRELLWFSGVITSLATIGVVVLLAMDKDPSAILYVIGVPALTIGTTLLAQMHANTREVKEQTNGRMSQLIDLVSQRLPPPAPQDELRTKALEVLDTLTKENNP